MRKQFPTALAVLLLTASSLAQNTDINALAGINFNFGNPGARSMGMGGAFLALADDASAAEANPAGLTILRKLEVSVEGRHFRNSQEMPVTGVYPDLVTRQFSESSRALEVQFASVVAPRENFALAIYYHQPLNYENEFLVAPEVGRFGEIIRDVPTTFFPRGNPPGSAGPISEEECRKLPLGECLKATLLPFFSIVHARLDTYGLAAAVRLGELSVGASARYHEFSEGAFEVRFFQGEADAIAIQATNLDVDSLEEGSEGDVTFAAGLKWTVTDKLSVGAAYKQGPEFPAPLHLVILEGELEVPQLIAKTSFHFPDVAGVGLSFRPNPRLTVNADVVHIGYSNLTDNFLTNTTGMEVLENPFVTEDAIEIHFGGEYFFPTTIPFALRAGWWRDPAHSIEYVGPLNCTEPEVPEDERIPCVANRIIERMYFPRGEDRDHFTVGVGLAWPSFQLDAAYDSAREFKSGSVSAVYRF